MVILYMRFSLELSLNANLAMIGQRVIQLVIRFALQVPFEGTTSYADNFKGWQLPASRPSIGVVLKGDAVHTLVPRCALCALCTIVETLTDPDNPPPS